MALRRAAYRPVIAFALIVTGVAMVIASSALAMGCIGYALGKGADFIHEWRQLAHEEHDRQQTPRPKAAIGYRR